MTSAEFLRLKTEFLKFCHDWHAARDFAPFDVLAVSEGLQVDDLTDEPDGYNPRTDTIILNRLQGTRRKRHTKMHELAHYLFKKGAGKAYFMRLDTLCGLSLDAQRDWEEVFVEEAGLQLLIPQPMFREVCRAVEEDARRAQILAASAGCSLAAAAARIAYAFPRPISGIILNHHGRVTDCFSNNVRGSLNAGKDFTVSEDHPVRRSCQGEKLIYFKAHIPFKHSPKEIPRHMQALYDAERRQTIVFFNAPYGLKSGMQSLFSEVI